MRSNTVFDPSQTSTTATADSTDSALVLRALRAALGFTLAFAVAACGGDSTGPGGGPNPGPDYGSAIGVNGFVVDSEGTEPDYGSAIGVNGFVVDSEGTEIFGSVVQATVEVWDEGCDGETVESLTPSESALNEAGEYALFLTFDRDEFDACVLVEVIPPSGSGFQSGTEFLQDVDVNAPTDVIRSFRIDFVLEES